MKKKIVFIIISIISFLFTIVTFLFPFVLPCVIFEEKYELICLKIRKKNVIKNRRNFIKIGTKIIDNFFFKSLTILLVIFIFSLLLFIFFGFKKYLIDAVHFFSIGMKFVYDFIFNSAEFYNPYNSMKFNSHQLFFICYLLTFFYLFICLNLISLFGIIYLKKHWKKNFKEIILFDDNKETKLVSNNSINNQDKLQN